MQSYIRLFTAVLIVLCSSSTSLFAQNATGRISGAITDTTGAAVSIATVTITNRSTGLKAKTKTDASGYYLFTNLAVAIFDVEVEADGFRKQSLTGFDLVDAGRLTADFQIKVGSVNESIVVNEVLGETVNTVSGEVSHTINSEQVQDMALNGRNYMQLVSLIPGVALLNEDQMATTTSLSVANQSINGNRSGTSHLMVDGGMNLDSGSNGSQINNVGVDFIQEVKVSTSAFSAEYGRNSGASINVVTKSGGQTFHGSLFETLRNDALDAKDYFAPVKPKLRFNNFGWSLNGPVEFGLLKKGKLFFMAGQDYKRIRRFTSAARVTIPTRAERQGQFADRTTTSIYYPGTKTPVPNKDLSGLMTADGRAIMNVYNSMEKLAAVYVDTPTGNNATFQVLNPFNFREDLVRIDWKPAEKHSVYARYIHDNYNTIDPFGTFGSSALPNTPTIRNRPGYGPQLGYTWTINRTMINETKLNASWNGQRTPLQGDNWKRDTFGFQFPRLFGGDRFPNGIPDITISGFTGYKGPAGVFLLSPTTDITLSNNFTLIAGHHTLKMGVAVIRNRKDQNGRPAFDGTVGFNPSGNGGTTNFAVSDAALGLFRTYGEAANDPVGFFRFTQYDGFVQDSWRLTKKFSLELGIRLSRFYPTYTSANNIVNFDPSIYNQAQAVSITPLTGLVVPGSGNQFNGLIRAGDGIPSDQVGRIANATSKAVQSVPTGAPRGLYDPSTLFMPRFGFAYSPFKKIAIRGGFGIYHDRVQGNVIFSQLNLPPFSSTVSYENGSLSNPSGGTAAALAPYGSINAIDKNLKTPSTYTYNFSIENELPKGFFLNVTYAGNLQRHLLRQPDVNNPSFQVLSDNLLLPTALRPVTNSLRPYRGYSNIRMFLSDSNANYNSLQTRLSRSKGNTVMTVNYTWSKVLSDTSGDTDNPEEYSNRHYNYGPASFDRRHIFVLTYTYRIPLLRQKHGIVGLLGRWEISGIVRDQSGPQLSVISSTSIATRRSDYIGGVVELPSDQRSPNHWFNTDAFSLPPNSRLGTSGVGVVQGPGLYLWDLSLRKEFPLTERFKLKFQVDAFNMMNHANFRGLNVTTTSAGNAFGSVTGSGPARNIQFGARVIF